MITYLNEVPIPLEMASATSTPTPPDAQADDDDNVADLPMTMAASVVLDQLPRDAHTALETAGELKDASGQVRGKGTLLHKSLRYRMT